VRPSRRASATSVVDERLAVLVERGVRLVEQPDRRVGQQQAGEREALAHPARVGAHQVVGRAQEPDAREQPVEASASGGSGRAARRPGAGSRAR
jgi:hypothetical protein